MIEMCHDRNRRGFGEVAKHCAENRQGCMRAAAGPGLQYHGRAFGFGGGDIGAHILPPETDEATYGVAVFQRGLQDFGKGRESHLNFAIMSLMPGMVSI
jgi:hypothetical protein